MLISQGNLCGRFFFFFSRTDFNTVNVTPGKLTHVFPGGGGGGGGGRVGVGGDGGGRWVAGLVIVASENE